MPLVLRLNLDSLDISTNIVQEAAMFRFRVILENLNVFLSDKIRHFSRVSSLNFDCDSNAPNFELPSSLQDFICLLKTGFFQLVLTNHEPPLLDEEGYIPSLYIRFDCYLNINHVHNLVLNIFTYITYI